MIESLVRKFNLIEKDVNLLTKVLTILLLFIWFRACYLAYVRDFVSIWGLLGPLTSVAATLLISRIASRLIVHGQVLKEDERRQEIVKVTHQLLAVTKDLKAKVGYFNKLMREGDKPVVILVSLARSIEKRYETLYERDAYKFLQGKSVDLISNLSGSIFGILAVAEALGSTGSINLPCRIEDLAAKKSDDLKVRSEKLSDELQTLIDQIYDVRISLDASVDEKP